MPQIYYFLVNTSEKLNIKHKNFFSERQKEEERNMERERELRTAKRGMKIPIGERKRGNEKQGEEGSDRGEEKLRKVFP